jgi:23S rRNA pseudouridine2604 synthase
MEETKISLNKYISGTGFCSRRMADEIIEQARVTVNDKTAKPGAKIWPTDKIAIDGELLKQKKNALYIALNKPVGVTSTTDPKDKTNIINFMNYPKRIFPIGRLDKESDGLIFLTNDGDIVNKILRAGNMHEKEYIVMVDKPIDATFVKNMSAGVPMLGTTTRPCVVNQEGNKRFRITLTQGLNRQIRRMCATFDYKVVKLTRIRIMNISLGDLAVGAWRYLSPAEIEKMMAMVANSSKTPDVVKTAVAAPEPEEEDEETYRYPTPEAPKKRGERGTTKSGRPPLKTDKTSRTTPAKPSKAPTRTKAAKPTKAGGKPAVASKTKAGSKPTAASKTRAADKPKDAPKGKRTAAPKKSAPAKEAPKSGSKKQFLAQGKAKKAKLNKAKRM